MEVKGKKALWCGYLTVHKKKMHYYYDDEYHRGIIVDVVVVIIIICFFSSSLVLRGVRRKVLHATSPVYSLYSMIVVCVVTSYYGLVEMMVVWLVGTAAPSLIFRYSTEIFQITRLE